MWKAKKYVLLVVISVAFASVHAQKVFRFQSEIPEVIIDRIEAYTDFTFSYLDEVFTKDKYTFSVDNNEDLPYQLAIAFETKLRKLDSTYFAFYGFQEQTPVITGRIIHSGDSQAIIGATFYLPDLELGYISNEEGEYLIKGVFAENEQVLISYLGYEEKVISVSELKAQKFIQLHEKEHMLSDIVITDFTSYANKSQSVLELVNEASSSSPDQDVLEVAQSTSGVYSSSESLSDLQIRGGPPDQVSFNWNGIRLFQNSLFYGRISSVNPFMVDEVRITKNGASADQTAEASGAINLASNLNEDTTQLRFHANLLYVNAYFSTSLLNNKLKLKSAFRRSINDIYESQSFRNFYGNTFQFGRIQDVAYYLDSFDILEFSSLIPSFSFQDFTFSGQFELGKQSYIRADYVRFGNNFDYKVRNDFDSSFNQDDFGIGNNGASLNWKQVYTENITSDVRASLSKYQYRYYFSEDGSEATSPFRRQENDITQYNINGSLKYIDKKFSLEGGYEFHNWDVRYEDTSTIESDLWSIRTNEQLVSEHALFVVASFYSKPWYFLEAGLRRSALGRVILEPRINLSVFPCRYWTLHAHFGSFHQNLNRRNINTRLFADNGFWLLSDERAGTNDFIPIVQQSQISGGIKYQKSKFTLSADLYEKRGKNIWTSAFDFSSDEDPFEFSNTITKGVELALAFGMKNVYARWTYDYVSEQLTTLFSEKKFRSPYSQPHRFSFIQGVRYHRFKFDTQLRYASGRYFSVPMALIQVEDSDQGLINELTFEDLFDFQVDDYIRLDASMIYQQKINSNDRKYFQIKFQVLNLLNRSNTIKNRYFVDYRKDPPESNLFQRIGLPLTYNLSLEVQL